MGPTHVTTPKAEEKHIFPANHTSRDQTVVSFSNGCTKGIDKVFSMSLMR